MDKTSPAMDADRLRDYYLAFGSLGHYLKRAEEFHASRATPEPLPPRWLHLAERSLLRAHYPKYSEFFDASGDGAEISGSTLAALDSLVERINAMLLRPEILSAFRQKDSPELAEFSAFYRELGRLINIGDSGV